MLTSMAQGESAALERAFSHTFKPDSYEVLNVYKLYDQSLDVKPSTQMEYQEHRDS